MRIKNDDTSSLSHTKWNCQYHIIFCPKYRRKAIYGKPRADIGKYLRRLCEYKGVEIVEAHACVDHIHMLVKIPPKLSVSSFMGYLKGKSSLMIFEEHSNLKYNYGSRTFWNSTNAEKFLYLLGHLMKKNQRHKNLCQRGTNYFSKNYVQLGQNFRNQLPDNLSGI